jgi:Tfp pilus assembly protein PilN
MPSINMITTRRADKLRRENNLRNTVYAIIAEIGLVVICLSFLSIRLAALTAHIAELDGQIVKLQPKVSQIQKLQQETARLMPKVDTLDGAKKDTLFWYSNLFAVANSLPPKTWLTSIATTLPAAGNVPAPGANAGPDPTMSVSGIATSHTDVGEAMLRMNQSPTLDHVDLAFDQSQKVGKTDTVAFQMTVHFKPEPGSSTQGGPNDRKS